MMMKAFLRLALLGLCSLSLWSCATTDPSGSASGGGKSVNDKQIMALPPGASLSEMQKAFGPGESQPGPRVTYPANAKEHPGEYYWVYSYRPHGDGAEWMVHHIVLADRTEENGKVVWPAKWLDMSPASAAYVLRKAEGNP